MNELSVAEWLNSLTDKQFVEFFYRWLAARHIFREDELYLNSRLVLGNVSRELLDDETWGDWDFQLLCPTPHVSWVDDAPICQFGHHCGIETASWAKNSICPVCGGEVYGT